MQYLKYTDQQIRPNIVNKSIRYFEAFHTVHSCSQSILLSQLKVHNMLNK
jgi:hypothetical protein